MSQGIQEYYQENFKHWPGQMVIAEHVQSCLKASKLVNSIWDPKFKFPDEKRNSPACLHCCLYFLVNDRNYSISFGGSDNVFFKLADGHPVKPVCLEARGKTMCLTLLNDKRHTLEKEFNMVQHGPYVLGEDRDQKPLRIGDEISFKVITVPVDTLTAEQLYNCFIDIHSAALLEWILLKLNKPSLKGRITIKKI